MLAHIQQTASPIAIARPQKEEEQLQEKDKGTIAALDGVRAVAALLVVSLHISEIAGVPWDVNQNPVATAFAFFGRTGVVLFFVLSGFLLFMPYARALLFGEAWPSARIFYLRRIFRIWPGYYLTLFVMILFFSRAYLQPGHWPQLGLFLTFLMDSSPQTWQQIDGPFWTLATEWQFYMLLPVIALGFSLIVRRVAHTPQQRLRAVLCCCLGVILWGLLMRGFGLLYQRHPNMHVLLPHSLLNVFLFFTFGIQGKYLEVFALGMLVSALFVFACHVEEGRALQAFCQRWSHWLWGCGLLVLVFIALWQVEAETDRNAMPNFTTLSFFHPLRSFYAWVGEPIAGVGFALCLATILFGPPALKWFFETRPLRRIGRLSYSLYMWHLNLLLVFNSAIVSQISAIGGSLGKIIALWSFVFLVLFPFCYLFYKCVEEPGIRLGARLTRRKSASPSHFRALLSLPARGKEE